MTKQELREGIANKIHSEMFDLRRVHNWDDVHDYAKAIVNYLHSQGVVIKVDEKLPSPFDSEDNAMDAVDYKKKLKDFAKVVPLIEEV